MSFLFERGFAGKKILRTKESPVTVLIGEPVAASLAKECLHGMVVSVYCFRKALIKSLPVRASNSPTRGDFVDF